MKLKTLAEKCGWKLLTGIDSLDKEVQGCYVGDLLSWVMARAGENEVWITVMGNVNVIAVAVLTEVSAIVLSEGATLDEDAREKALQQKVAVFATDNKSYQTAIKVYKCLKEQN